MRISVRRQWLLVVSVIGVWQGSAAAAEPAEIAADVLSAEQRGAVRELLDQQFDDRTRAVNAANRQAWNAIDTKEKWEAYRDERIARLRRALAEFPEPAAYNVRVGRYVAGEGFTIENLVYESRPGFWVTANLYVPDPPRDSMPGILIAHSHHRDKPEGELQDMGMTWARAGCLVLVIDQVGYGERRAHPFHTAADYAQAYKVSRQDYFFRYDSGVQLSLLGDSLMGWMAWDWMRGVDLLLARKGCDPTRIVMLGAVAGGGDPAGVTAALDPRITGCVPFNFGGPQPETRYPLPEDAETTFNYLGGTYWESTRGLRLGGRDDFPHWVIVASIAPRRLIHGHEFSWDGERDPVWRRYQKIWGDFYGQGDGIGVAHGHGLLRQSSAEASHCNNIGRVHRKMIHPLFARWFDIHVKPEDEYSQPRSRPEMISLTPELRDELKPQTLLAAMSAEGERRIARARLELQDLPPAARREKLRQSWSGLLGPVAPAKGVVKSRAVDAEPQDGMRVERLRIETEPGFLVPVLVLSSPEKERAGGSPVVVGLAQEGKAGFLKERRAELRRLTSGGAIVVLPDLRGTGETSPASSRGKDSGATNLSAHYQLFGETFVGARLRDLRTVLGVLRTRDDVDPRRIALWGDSFAPRNVADANLVHPRGGDAWPLQSEPLGGVLALLGGLFEEDVAAVCVDHGLTSYADVLRHWAVLIPHDATVPGALTAGDLPTLAASLAPRPLRITNLVNERNQGVAQDALTRLYSPAVVAYANLKGSLLLVADAESEQSAADWLLGRLK